MPDFYNPYQFIPVTGKVGKDATPTTPFADIKAGRHPAIRHDAWQQDLHSGRMVCAVHLHTPTVVGGLHEPGDKGQRRPVTVRPYTIEGQPAIPGNSLRGMVGAVAEALSQSALRVLRDETYSVRKQVQARESLSAIGMVRREIDMQGREKYFILPLCMPMLELPGNVPEKWRKTFANDSLRMCMAAYVNGYRFDANRAYRTGFLNRHDPRCYHMNNRQFFYAKLSRDLDRYAVADVSTNIRGLYIKREMFVLGQRILEDRILIEAEFNSLQPSEKPEYVRGFLYVLGIQGREAEIPHTKRHERFIPYPETRKKFRKIPIQESALKNFQAIAKQRIEAPKEGEIDLPFLPQGYSLERFKENGGKPSDGDLMYFNFENLDGIDQVTEISYSAIWRRPVKGTVHGAFAKIQPNLVPWGSPSRSALTPAEALFGVVADRNLSGRPESQNLASRLRFHDAKPLGKLNMLPSVTLKALSSPKPPAPCLYFKNQNSHEPAKKSNLDLEKHTPNGRKVYIPHPEFQAKRADWETGDKTDRPHLKMSCEPMAAGQSLYFHIDFENLDDAELSLLITALRPDGNFLHRLGLGKPLGLGAVRLEILGVFYVDRLGRYRVEGLDTPRYARLTRVCGSGWPEGLAGRYPQETAMFTNTEIPSSPTREDRRYIDRQTESALVQLGSPGSYDPQIPVRYPYAQTQAETGETELFQWFVNNETAAGQGYQVLPEPSRGQRLKAMSRR